MAVVCLLLLGFVAVMSLFFHYQWVNMHRRLSEVMMLVRSGWRHSLTVDGWIHPLVKGETYRAFSLADAVKITRDRNWQLHQLMDAYQAESATAREKALAFKIRVLKSEIRQKDETLRQKNIMLDALYYVWCSGGCNGGTRKWLPKDVSEEIVVAAELNTARLRRWWNIKKSRQKE